MNKNNNLPGGLIKGRYRALSPIGSGGVGRVFYGMDEQLQRPVAIKRLLEEDSKRNVEYGAGWMEARALASLQHPNIVTLFDFGEDQDGVFFVMEYIDGATLEKLASHGLLGEIDFRTIARQCLAGIGAAHELGIVHRDIKPTNIMVQQGGAGETIVKILDFGLAKFQKAPEHQTTDHEDNLLGSIHFMAPEQFTRELVDARADLYALGNVFYFALTGRMAHSGDSIQQIIYSHLQEKPAPLFELRPDLSPALCLWVQQLMERDPVERPQTAREALDLLEPEGMTPGVRQPRWKPTIAAPVPQRKPWRLFLVLILLAGGAGLFFYWFLNDTPRKLVPSAPVTAGPVEKEEPETAVAPVTDSLPPEGKKIPPVADPEITAVDPLDKGKLRELKGQQALVRGIPVRVGENKAGTILYLNFSEDFQSSLSLLFFVKGQPDRFTRQNLEKFLNKEIEISGKIEEYNGAAQMKVGSLEQIREVEP